MKQHKHNWIKKANGEFYCSSCGADKGLRVFFYQGYGGVPKCEAKIEGVEYVIELDELAKDLEEAILEKGYTVSKTNRQKYPRLVINK